MISNNVRPEGGIFTEDALVGILNGQSEFEHLDAQSYKILDPGKTLLNHISELYNQLKGRWEWLKGQPQADRFDQWAFPILESLGWNTRALQPKAGLRIGEHGDGLLIVAARDLDEGGASTPQSRGQLALNSYSQEWGILLDADTFRLIRNSASLTRQSYVEFHVDGIFAEDDMSAFSLLYLLLHETRFQGKPCALEGWRTTSQATGARPLNEIKKSVEEAIRVLGTGFLQHPSNGVLRRKISEKSLSPEDYYRQVLRVVYRLIFLFVTEDRDLLLTPSSSKEAREYFSQFYGTQRLRRVAADNPGTNHGDQWECLRVVFRGLKGLKGRDQTEGIPELALPPLNGPMWKSEFIADLDDARLTNMALFAAVRRLLYFGDQRENVNWRGLGAEELGGIYEGLLEDKPVIKGDSFDLVADEGKERATTGAHYTPTSIIDKVLAGSLFPILADRIKPEMTKEQKATELLSITVCDPACGSGHFLLAAARALADRLAEIRTGNREPPASAIREAMRDVISHCIYGVDINEMSVELCKVGLWLEAIEPGRPLTYLEHHVRCGDALFGASPEFLRAGIPAEAYEPRPDIDREDVCKTLRERNETFAYGQKPLEWIEQDLGKAQETLRELHAHVEALPDGSIEEVEAKAEAYDVMYSGSKEHQDMKLACDAWCAAFTYPKRSAAAGTVISNLELSDCLLEGYEGARSHPWAETVHAESIARKFFHWHLEFPAVMLRGGFDCILGNPPYLGGSKVSGVMGLHYNRFLQRAYEGYSAQGDLASAFLRRMSQLAGPAAAIGLVTTNSISEGRTRENGLAHLLADGLKIQSAWPNLPWPGEGAQVDVSIVCLGRADGSPKLGGIQAASISSRLDTLPEHEPKPIPSNKGRSFKGHEPAGAGFIVSKQEARKWIAQDPRTEAILLPFFTGDVAYDNPTFEPDRWIICFRVMDETEAQEFPELLAHLESTVKPQRQEANRESRRNNWWRFGEYRQKLERQITGLTHVIVKVGVSDNPWFLRVENSYCFGNSLIVIASDQWQDFAVLNSTLHETWLRKFAPTMQNKPQYTTAATFDPFPFPATASTELAVAGSNFQEALERICRTQTIGLTKVWHLFNDATSQGLEITELRRLKAVLDTEVLTAYGWGDVSLGHGFFDDARGRARYTVDPKAQDELIRRLITKNAADTSAPLTGSQRKQRRLDSD